MSDLPTEPKPRIALVCPSFAGGGAERVMVTLANKFIDWGYPVDFIVGLDVGPYRNMLSSSVQKVVLADEGAGKFNKRLQALKRLHYYFSVTEASVMMSTIREFNILVLFTRMLSRFRMNVVVREADTLDELFVDGGVARKILYACMRFFYPKSTGVIANCRVTKDDLVERSVVSASRIDVIYNPVAKLGTNDGVKDWPAGVKKIIGCGRLTDKKNFVDLIKVIPLLKQKYGNVCLRLLGEGEERRKLENLINELGLEQDVELVGFVNNPYDYYASADVFVQTSLWEGFGYVLAEAMACGTPVVAYDSRGAMREILSDGKYGKLAPVGNLQALADAIIQQIEDPTPPDVLVEAVQRFDVDVIAKQYLVALGLNHE